MFKRDNIHYNRYQSLLEDAKEQSIKDMQEVEKRKKEVADFYDNLNRYRKQRELRNSEISRMSESVANDHLRTAFEAIYISALQEAGELSESGISIADILVKNYIIENGGATAIMRRNAKKTYLLDFLFECVKVAHNKDMESLLGCGSINYKDLQNIPIQIFHRCQHGILPVLKMIDQILQIMEKCDPAGQVTVTGQGTLMGHGPFGCG